MRDAKSAPTPLSTGYIPEPHTGNADPSLRSRFQMVIGSLLYIMLGTRLDIAFAVTRLAQFAANPSQDHLNRAMYICRYLACTADYELVFDGDSDMGLIGFADSDHAGSKESR